MKKQSLTFNRIALGKQTDNHYTLELMHLKLDFTFQKLFAVTVGGQSRQIIYCRTMRNDEKRHSGQHFNTIQPNKKARLPEREWLKKINMVFSSLNLEIPKGGFQ